MTALFVSTLLPLASVANQDDALDATAPGLDLRTEQKLNDALRTIPESKQIDAFFGISGGNPEQSPGDSLRATEMLEQIRALGAESTDVNVEALLAKIGLHSNNPERPTDGLRSLMYGKKQK